MKKIHINNDDNYATPPDFYEQLNSRFNFDFDPCPYNENEIVNDGLKIEWGQSNFINPPYSDKKESGFLKSSFVKKAIEESKKGKTCVMLLPVSTSTKLFHDYILPNATEIRFLKGRVKFSGTNTKGEQVTNKCGMHDSMVVVFLPCA